MSVSMENTRLSPLYVSDAGMGILRIRQVMRGRALFGSYRDQIIDIDPADIDEFIEVLLTVRKEMEDEMDPDVRDSSEGQGGVIGDAPQIQIDPFPPKNKCELCWMCFFNPDTCGFIPTKGHYIDKAEMIYMSADCKGFKEDCRI